MCVNKLILTVSIACSFILTCVPTGHAETMECVLRSNTGAGVGASCPSDCANGPTGSDQWDLVLFSGLLCESSVCGSVEADLASFSANPDRRCPKCRRNTFRCWSGGDRQNSAIRLHARRPGSQRREWQSAKGALRRSRPPRPLSPSPVSPNAEGASPRACLCFVAALGRDRRD
jgi:hypothetical protein